MAVLIHQPPATFYVSVNSTDVTNKFNPYLISITIVSDLDVGNDTCEILLDDSNGQLDIPAASEEGAVVGADMTVGLGWTDTGPIAVFLGTVMHVKSHGSRHHGRTLTISADSTDLTQAGMAKSTINSHIDDKTYQDAASAIAKSVGYTVDIKGNLANIHREYWSLGNESFMNWLKKTAEEMGGEVMFQGKKAVVTPIGAKLDVADIECVCGPDANVISWDIIPEYARVEFSGFQALQYDPLKAEMNNVLSGGSGSGGGVAGNKSKMPTMDQAQQQADANKKKNESQEYKRGDLTIIGEPTAKVSGTVNIQGARPGVDGPYQIHMVEHHYSRGGYMTTMKLVAPGEAS